MRGSVMSSVAAAGLHSGNAVPKQSAHPHAIAAVATNVGYE